MNDGKICDGCGETLTSRNTALQWRTGYALCLDCWKNFTPFERASFSVLMDIRDKVHGEQSTTLVPRRALTLFLDAEPEPELDESNSIPVGDRRVRVYKRSEVPVMCPDCSLKLLERSGPHGPFMGCAGYPRCRRTYTLEV